MALETGLIFTPMTTSTRNAISTPSTGRVIFNIDVLQYQFWNGTIWQNLLGGSAGNSLTWASSIPSSGTWKQGDIAYNTAAAPSGFAGWICTTGGTPGTWKTFGAISA